MRRSGSTRTPRRKLMSIIRPPSQSAAPATLWPPPRTDNGMRVSRAKFTQATTSALPLTRAIRAGRFAIIAFQIVRACVSRVGGLQQRAAQSFAKRGDCSLIQLAVGLPDENIGHGALRFDAITKAIARRRIKLSCA